MAHLQLTDFHKDNYHLYVEKPDAGFSAKRNYAIINQTITEYETMRYTVDPKVKENAADRADIIASWAKYKLDEGGGKQLEEWLGKSWMTKIYGEKLLEKIRVADTIRRLNKARGNTKFENYYLT